jgi:hypothetical protein
MPPAGEDGEKKSFFVDRLIEEKVWCVQDQNS